MNRWMAAGLVALVAGATFDAREAAAKPKPSITKTSPFDAQRADRFDSLVRSSSVVAPLGISPFFALAALGVAAQLDYWQPPETLGFLSHPLIWAPFILLGLLIQFGRSTKITKPLAEALGTGESVIALVSVGLAMIPIFQNAQHQVVEAGMLSGLFALTVGLCTVGVIIVLRTALDVLTWMSPFPFVDLLFQLVKAITTAILLALAIFAPVVAAVVNLIIFIAAIFALRWALRMANFGLKVTWDLSVGRFGERLAMPRDEVVAEDLGPFMAFVEDVKGLPRRAEVEVRVDAGRWYLKTHGGGPNSLPLGEADKSVLTRRLTGTLLTSGATTVLFPGRYTHLMNEIAKVTRAELVSNRPTMLRAQRPRTAPG